MASQHVEIAVCIPCYNEAPTVARVVARVRRALPEAVVYVYDNASTDGTARLAAGAGAVVRTESRRGKGNVVRRMFADIEADVYVLVDGDDTYHPDSAPEMIRLLRQGPCDMVNGARVTTRGAAYRAGHRFGNAFFTGLVGFMFGARIEDMLSGFKVFSRRFVKSFPALSSGFEIETEILVHALEMGVPMAEVQTPYKERPEGSHSKLATFRDGRRILLAIFTLLRAERPLAFFGCIAGFLALLCLAIGLPVVFEYFATGVVPRFPSAFLAAALGGIAVNCFFTGLILDLVRTGRHEAKKLAYLSFRPPHGEAPETGAQPGASVSFRIHEKSK